MKAVLFDKFKNRLEKELDIPNGQEEFTMMQDVKGESYQIKYVLQFYDMKKRPVYVEKSRVFIKSEIL